MFHNILKSAGERVTILYVDSEINQTRTAHLLKKLRYESHYLMKAFVIVCSVEDAMPVQVDKIFQEVKRIKEQHQVPIYGFVLDVCNPESYYMLSVADEIYSLPSTVFKLKRNHYRLDWQQCFQSYGFEKYSVRSSDNLSGSYLDKWTAPDTQHLRNRKETEISQIMYEDAIARRKAAVERKSKLPQKPQTQNVQPKSDYIIPPKDVPRPITGTEAVSLGLIDGTAEHYQFIKEKYPDCYVHMVKFMQDPIQLKKALILISSPILVMIFLFKVCLKWALIIYFWIKGNKKKKQTHSEKMSIINE